MGDDGVTDRDFQGLNLSMPVMGAMRLPVIVQLSGLVLSGCKSESGIAEFLQYP